MSCSLYHAATPSRNHGDAVTSWTLRSGVCCPVRVWASSTEPSPSINPRMKPPVYIAGIAGQSTVKLFRSVSPIERKKFAIGHEVIATFRCMPLFLKPYRPPTRANTRSMSWKSLEQISIELPPVRHPSLQIRPVNHASSSHQWSMMAVSTLAGTTGLTRPASFRRRCRVDSLAASSSGIFAYVRRLGLIASAAQRLLQYRPGLVPRRVNTAPQWGHVDVFI